MNDKYIPHQLLESHSRCLTSQLATSDKSKIFQIGIPDENHQVMEKYNQKRQMHLASILDPNKKMKKSLEMIQELVESKSVSPLNVTIADKEFSIIARSSDKVSLVGTYDQKIEFEDMLSRPSTGKFTDTLEETYPQHLCGAKSNQLFHTEAQKKYVAISKQILDILNQEWDDKDFIQYISLRFFEGMMIVNEQNCVCIEAVELYNRKESIDKHRERFDSTESSLPDGSSNFKVVVFVQKGYQQLIFGTQIFNALITSYMRSNEPGVRLGPTYIGPKDFHNTQIFILKDVLIKLNQDLIEGTFSGALDQSRAIFQLRQLRSQFHELSTYLRLRSWGPILEPQNMRPVTIWTLHLYTTQKRCDSSAIIGSELFAAIAREVWAKKELATITKEYVKGLVKRAKKNKTTRISAALEKVSLLFQGRDELNIIGNVSLNRLLQDMAEALSKSIPRRNESIERNILK
ncbi:hypothetical protein BGX20_005056 [Mortierella sp. AD010]|nr:hypothetical protein BGX20_005056 [Mortierella sp. AD010]